MVMALLSLACTRTPPHDPVVGTWAVTPVARRELTWDGVYCAWESEDLTFEGMILSSAPPPDLEDGVLNEGWCEVGGESARLVDVVGQDGPFLSTRVQHVDCCPERAEARCVTWDVRTRAQASLEAYDPRRAAVRRRKLDKLLAEDRGFDGWVIAPDAFLLFDGHVRFCATRGGEVREIPIP